MVVRRELSKDPDQTVIRLYYEDIDNKNSDEPCTTSLNLKKKTRQVYNGPRTSNLSKQQQQI